MQTLINFAKREEAQRTCEDFAQIIRQGTLGYKVDSHLQEAAMKRMRTAGTEHNSELDVHITSVQVQRAANNRQMAHKKLNVIRKTTTQRAVMQTGISIQQESEPVAEGSINTHQSHRQDQTARQEDNSSVVDSTPRVGLQRFGEFGLEEDQLTQKQARRQSQIEVKVELASPVKRERQVLVKSPTKEITYNTRFSINRQETVPASEKSEEQRKTLKVENSQQFLSILNQSSTHSQPSLNVFRKKATRISQMPSGMALQQSNEPVEAAQLSHSTPRVDQQRSNNFELELDQRTATISKQSELSVIKLIKNKPAPAQKETPKALVQSSLQVKTKNVERVLIKGPTVVLTKLHQKSIDKAEKTPASQKSALKTAAKANSRSISRHNGTSSHSRTTSKQQLPPFRKINQDQSPVTSCELRRNETRLAERSPIVAQQCKTTKIRKISTQQLKKDQSFNQRIKFIKNSEISRYSNTVSLASNTQNSPQKPTNERQKSSQRSVSVSTAEIAMIKAESCDRGTRAADACREDAEWYFDRLMTWLKQTHLEVVQVEESMEKNQGTKTLDHLAQKLPKIDILSRLCQCFDGSREDAARYVNRLITTAKTRLVTSADDDFIRFVTNTRPEVSKPQVDDVMLEDATRYTANLIQRVLKEIEAHQSFQGGKNVATVPTQSTNMQLKSIAFELTADRTPPRETVEKENIKSIDKSSDFKADAIDYFGYLMSRTELVQQQSSPSISRNHSFKSSPRKEVREAPPILPIKQDDLIDYEEFSLQNSPQYTSCAITEEPEMKTATEEMRQSSETDEHVPYRLPSFQPTFMAQQQQDYSASPSEAVQEPIIDPGNIHKEGKDAKTIDLIATLETLAEQVESANQATLQFVKQKEVRIRKRVSLTDIKRRMRSYSALDEPDEPIDLQINVLDQRAKNNCADGPPVLQLNNFANPYGQFAPPVRTRSQLSKIILAQANFQEFSYDTPSRTIYAPSQSNTQIHRRPKYSHNRPNTARILKPNIPSSVQASTRASQHPKSRKSSPSVEPKEWVYTSEKPLKRTASINECTFTPKLSMLSSSPYFEGQRLEGTQVTRKNLMRLLQQQLQVSNQQSRAAITTIKEKKVKITVHRQKAASCKLSARK